MTRPDAESALDLRLVLASFGLVVGLAGAVGFGIAGLVLGAVVFAVLAVTAVVDLVVVQRRRHQRAAREHGEHHSLFE